MIAHIPSPQDIEQHARYSYDWNRSQGVKDLPPWDEADSGTQGRYLNRARAYLTALRKTSSDRPIVGTFTLAVNVPALGDTVIYQDKAGYPLAAIVTGTEPTMPTAVFGDRIPRLKDELTVHLHVLSPVGPYAAYAVDYGDGPECWRWPTDELPIPMQAHDEDGEGA